MHPEFFPIKPLGAFLSVDFVAGCSFGCRFCISRRHPDREALFRRGRVVDLGLEPAQVLDWLESMPSFRAGVQLRIGHDTDAGLELEPSADLVARLPADRSVLWLSRRPLTARAREVFGRAGPGVLLKLTATPASRALGIDEDGAAELLRSARPLPAGRVFWVLGPLAADSEASAARLIDRLPVGSFAHLKPLNVAGLPAVADVAPLGPATLARLEARAAERGIRCTEFFCRLSLAPLGRAFFDVDQIADRRVCDGCPSRALCHAPVDEVALARGLERELRGLGLTPLGPPRRTAARSFEQDVAEPSSRGDETYLSHALGAPVRIRLSTREPGATEGGSFCRVEEAVLRRWQERGFMPVADLERAAQRTLETLRPLLGGGDAPERGADRRPE